MALKILAESMVMAFRSLIANKMRSVLTTLGIVIGVMTVVGLISVILGLNNYVANLLSSMGSNTFFVQKIDHNITSEEQYHEQERRPDLKLEYMDAIRKNCPHVEFVAARDMRSKKLSYGNKTTSYVLVMGTNEEIQNMDEMVVQNGRFITNTDEVATNYTCVLGYDTTDLLFGDADPIGQRIKISEVPFTVVGTIGKLGSVFGINRDNSVFIPMTTFEKLYGLSHHFTMLVKPYGDGSPEPAVEEVRALLRRLRGLKADEDDNFSIFTQQAMMALFTNLTGAIFAVMLGVGGISLVVGGVGIMNIMLVSVTERTREIGIRKALGAKRRDILFQFLVEALVLSLIGGILGVGLGVLIVKLISINLKVPAAAPAWVIILGVVFSGLVGVAFGLYPSNKAARMHPIEALRYE
jgi:putative ABC transport system permease protein